MNTSLRTAEPHLLSDQHLMEVVLAAMKRREYASSMIDFMAINNAMADVAPELVKRLNRLIEKYALSIDLEDRLIYCRTCRTPTFHTNRDSCDVCCDECHTIGFTIHKIPTEVQPTK